MRKEEDCDQYRKREMRHWIKVKPTENIIKNNLGFQSKSHMLKEVLLHINC